MDNQFGPYVTLGICQVTMAELPSGPYLIQLIDPYSGEKWSSTVIKVD